MAKPEDWHTKPLPEKHVVIEYGRQFSKEELTLIKKGVIPEEMEDKWFIYYHDSCLHFHRSWTGFTVYVVRFNEEEDKATAVDFSANRDTEQYKETSDEKDKAMLSFLIDTFLLNKMVPFPDLQAGPLGAWSVAGRGPQN